MFLDSLRAGLMVALRLALDHPSIPEQTYTSTGVRPPWVTEQQTAPAKANRE